MIRYLFIILAVIVMHTAALAQDVPKIRIDPSQAFGGTVSEYFDNIEYIPLETTKESLFGDREQMLVTDSSIIVNDFDTKSVLFFALNGKFITKQKFNQNRYFKLYQDKASSNIIVAVYDRYFRIVESERYSLQGQLINKTNSSFLKFTSEPDMVALSNNYNYYNQADNSSVSQGLKPMDDIFPLVHNYHNESLFKSSVPYNQLENAGLCNLYGYIDIGNKVLDGTVFAAIPLAHVIYAVSKDTAVPIYKVILPDDRTVPDDLLLSQNESRIDSISRIMQNNPNIVSNLSNIFFHKSCLFFRLNMQVYNYDLGSDSKNNYNLIYDTVKRKLVSLERIKADSATCFLPVSDFGTAMRGVEYNNGAIYSTVSSLEMFAAIEKTKNKNLKYPPRLQQYFSTQNRKSNPVIVKMRLKE